jgi:hypothetical protein
MLKKYSYLLGKTKEQAFAIGNEIAAVVTAQNPSPIKLKFEKVIYPLARTESHLIKVIVGLPPHGKKTLRRIQI